MSEFQVTLLKFQVKFVKYQASLVKFQANLVKFQTKLADCQGKLTKFSFCKSVHFARENAYCAVDYKSKFTSW